MDPLSIIAGTTGVLDVSFRLIAYLKDVKAGAEKVDEDIEALTQRIEALSSVNKSIETVFSQELDYASDNAGAIVGASALWKEIASNVKSCHLTLEKLYAVVKTLDIKTTSRLSSKFDGLRKYLKKQSMEEEFNKLKQQLGDNHSALQMLLISVDIVYQGRSQSTTNQKIEELETQIESLKQDPNLFSPKRLGNTLTIAQDVLQKMKFNEFFSTPRPVRSLFTGRQAILEELKVHLLSPSSTDERARQKRFVIHGLGGSGKTEFCCKFAEDNQHRFWGVFWIDASSTESARLSFFEIAKQAKIEPPSELSAKNWLSSVDRPWLLIIDNADDPRNDVESYFPLGSRGYVLITTRNPELALHGNVGPKYFQFNGLKEDEATNLLLEIADEPSPRSNETNKLANLITMTLGYLPLAILHAGTTIYRGVCSLKDYLASYNEQWDRIRRARRNSEVDEEHDTYMAVYSTYEIALNGLVSRKSQSAQDAVKLLQIFSFLHRENIQFSLLIQAATNPVVEQKYNQETMEEKRRLKGERKQITSRWLQSKFESVVVGLAMYLERLGMRPSLPDVLCVDQSGHFDKDRLRRALVELRRASLVTHNKADDSYSLHPVVHTWVRERPREKSEWDLADQAVQCHTAASLLSQAILLPPPSVIANQTAAEKKSVDDFRRSLMPHVDHVQNQRRLIQQKFAENQRKRRNPWPVFQAKMSTLQAREFAKFAAVYHQCGSWSEARDLLLVVYEFLDSKLGMEALETRRAASALAGSYRLLDQLSSAQALQEKILHSCKTIFGYDHIETFGVMDALGQTHWQQGHFSEARLLHEQAVAGFTKLKGRNDVKTLNAIMNLGAIYTKDCDFDAALQLLTEALKGLQENAGSSDEQTLTAKGYFAITHLERATHNRTGGHDLVEAHRMILEVVEERQRSYGKSHPLTLWSIADLARIKNAQGDHSEAEALFRAAISVAEQNLGADHIGTLFGRAYLAEVLIDSQQYQEAEGLLGGVIQAHQKARPNHPDKLHAMSFLLKAFRLQGKDECAAEIRGQIAQDLDRIGGAGHVWKRRLLDPV